MRFLSFFLFLTFLGCSARRGDAETPVRTALKNKNEQTPVAKSDSLPDISHIAQLKTSKGAITIGLYGASAPKTVENFVLLAKKKFFDGILFHRVAKDFVIQTGDPLTKNPKLRDEWGTGGKNAFGAEPFDDELDSTAASWKRGYKRGVLAMANNGANTNQSQFFIMVKDSPALPKKFTIFGHVLDGWNILDSIANAPIEPLLSDTDGVPKDKITIQSLTIQPKR